MNLMWVDEMAEYYSTIPAPTYDPFKATKAWLSSHAFLIGGRGHGKVYAQKVALREYQRHSALSRQLGKIPSVDVAKIRWRCRRPSAPVPPRGSWWDLQERISEMFANGTSYSTMKQDWLRDYDARNGTTHSAPSVVDNVNVVTDRIPPHIAALPEPEQGPALVEAIFERKRRAGK